VATEDDKLQLFESTVFKPEVERRKNDSLMVLLMQEVHAKIEAMDRRLTQHMTNETLVLAEEMALIYPEIVGLDANNKPSGIDYGRLSAILTAKVQEQQSVIDKLQEQMTKVMEMLKGSK